MLLYGSLLVRAQSPAQQPAMLAEIAWPAGQQPLAFVCGPTRFAETVAEELVALGYPPSRVKTERFGGT